MNYILISATSIEVKVSLVIRPETENDRMMRMS